MKLKEKDNTFKNCHSLKACMSAACPHTSCNYLHNPAHGCQSAQAVNMKDPFL